MKSTTKYSDEELDAVLDQAEARKKFREAKMAGKATGFARYRLVRHSPIKNWMYSELSERERVKYPDTLASGTAFEIFLGDNVPNPEIAELLAEDDPAITFEEATRAKRVEDAHARPLIVLEEIDRRRQLRQREREEFEKKFQAEMLELDAKAALATAEAERTKGEIAKFLADRGWDESRLVEAAQVLANADAIAAIRAETEREFRNSTQPAPTGASTLGPDGSVIVLPVQHAR